MSGALLPVINIASYLDPDASVIARAETAHALHVACRDVGFFYLDVSSFVSKQETDELEGLAREFFSKTQEEKDSISIRNGDGVRGYQRLNENVTKGKADSHEAIDLYPTVSNPDPSKPLWGTNQWPDIPLFREKYEQWTEKMKVLGLAVMEAMSDGLDMSLDEWAALRAQVDNSFWVLRIIGYPSLPDTHDGYSCGEHKDYGCLTFLYQDPTPSALQVRSPTTGEWITASPIPNCFVVNIGEMWEIWTGGMYKSTLHRVIHKGTNYRVSIPFFFEPNFDAKIEALPAAERKAKAEGIPLAPEVGGRKSVVYGDFLMSKVTTNFGKYD